MKSKLERIDRKIKKLKEKRTELRMRYEEYKQLDIWQLGSREDCAYTDYIFDKYIRITRKIKKLERKKKELKA